MAAGESLTGIAVRLGMRKRALTDFLDRPEHFAAYAAARARAATRATELTAEVRSKERIDWVALPENACGRSEPCRITRAGSSGAEQRAFSQAPHANRIECGGNLSDDRSAHEGENCAEAAEMIARRATSGDSALFFVLRNLVGEQQCPTLTAGISFSPDKSLRRYQRCPAQRP
jgi:hypothetical protein